MYMRVPPFVFFQNIDTTQKRIWGILTVSSAESTLLKAELVSLLEELKIIHNQSINTENWLEVYGLWLAVYKRLDGMQGSAAVQILRHLFNDRNMRRSLGMVSQFQDIINDPPLINP